MYNRDNRIMRKLLGRAVADTATEPPSGSAASLTSAPSIAPTTYRSSVSQNATHRAHVPILCLDASPDGRMAVLGGRHILKTVNVDGPAITEGVDVRAGISAQPAVAKGGASSLADQLSIKDVKWHGDATIFTACSNGKIFSYDLNRLGAGGGLEFVQTREDSRQVNTLDINPHRGSYLLSGSQDGLVRCFDIRAPQPSWTGGLTFRAVQAFKCNADGVRHVKWSPTDGMCFACGTESGVIMKWDIRKANSPLLRLAAHDKSCSSISWHPDGDHLMSAGWDSKCHVWNLSKPDKRQKARFTISTPAPVASVAWRPGLWSATSQGKRVAQVAVSYDDSSQRRFGVDAVHVWDLARPTMPFKEIDRFDAPPASLLWKDQDILWTAGRDGLFSQCDVAYAPRVIDRQSLSSMAFSPRGDVMMFLDERPHALRPRPQPPAQKSPGVQSETYGSSPTAPILSVSRSDSDDDVVGSFVGPRRITTHRPPQRRSSRSLPHVPGSASSTPPLAPESMHENSLTLDQSIRVTGMFRTQQAMAFGHIPASTKVDTYHYISTSYLEILERELPPRGEDGDILIVRVASILEKFARTAENATQFRLAQTWRILAYVVNLLLVRRGQYHLEKRLGLLPKAPKNVPARLRGSSVPGTLANIGEEDTAGRRRSSRSLAPGHRNRSVRSLLSEGIESTSSVPTPLAKPVENQEDSADDGFVPGKRLTPVIEPESFTLGPAAHPYLRNSPRKRLGSEPISVQSHESGMTEESITEGYDFYDMEALSRAIDVPMPRVQAPSPLPSVFGPRTPDARPPVVQRASETSLGHVFSSESESASARMSVAQGSFTGANGLKHDQSSSIKAKPGEDGTAPSEAAESEYESRIRGRDLEESPSKPPRTGGDRQPEDADEIFLISQTTVETDPYSQEPIPSQQSTAQTHHEVNGEPSEIQPHRDATKPGPADPPPPPRVREESQVVTETDYFPWRDDPDYPYPVSSAVTQPGPSFRAPVNPYTTIARAIAHETLTSALNASAMVLLLRSLVPDSVIDPFHATAILRQHHTRLVSMSLFAEAAHLRNLCVGGWPGGGGGGQPGGDGRGTWGEGGYPSIFGPAQQNVKVAFYCADCKKPRDVDPRDKRGVWRCERCKARMAPCAVCGHREADVVGGGGGGGPAAAAGEDGDGDVDDDDDDGGLCTWWYCPACAHGGHASCLEMWHDEDGDGCCPLDGCGHACLPGRYRSEAAASRSDELGRHVAAERRERSWAGAAQGPAGVRGDGNEVLQSRAVESVREALGRESAGAGAGSAGRGVETGVVGSPGAKGRERRKSVKFAGGAS